MKLCKRCGVSKPEDQFSKQKRTKDGLHTRCKECAREVSKEWYESHREYAKEKAHTYYHTVVKPRRESK